MKERKKILMGFILSIFSAIIGGLITNIIIFLVYDNLLLNLIALLIIFIPLSIIIIYFLKKERKEKAIIGGAKGESREEWLWSQRD